MASGQGQGLQITLVVFVILFLVAGVTTFLMVQQSNQYYTELQAAKNKAQEEEKARRLATDNLLVVSRKVGAPAEAPVGEPNDPPAVDPSVTAPAGTPAAGAAGAAAPPAGTTAPAPTTVMAVVNGHIAKARLRLGDPSIETYQQAFAKYASELNNARAQLAQLQTGHKTKRDEFEKLQSLKDTEVTALQEARDKAETERLSLATNMRTQMDHTSKEQEATRSQAQTTATEREQVIQEFNTLDKKAKTETGALEGQYGTFQRVNKLDDVPDGEVVMVHLPQRVVHLNIGAVDGLRPQETFSVWPKGGRVVPQVESEEPAKQKSQAADKKKAQSQAAGPKASIEVVRTTGPHSAIARIHWDSAADPIVPGDRVYSPLWTAGKRERFCLVGDFDLTGDGKNDRELLKKIIQRNGGIIDCELRDDGSRVGSLSPATDWFVRGTAPSTEENATISQRQTELQRDAEKLGVQVMTDLELYRYLGYRPNPRAVAAGGTETKAAPVAEQNTGGTSAN
jgi:hypothetical protein